MQERPKEYNLGFNAARIKREKKLNDDAEQKIIDAAPKIIIEEGLSWAVFKDGYKEGLKG